MPTFKVTDPETGLTLKLTGDSPPTEQELIEIFDSVSKGQVGGQGQPAPSQAPVNPQGVPTPQQPVPAQALVPQQPQEEPSLLDEVGAEFRNIGRNLGGALETGVTLGSSIIAEPLAGLAGLAKTITSGVDEGVKTTEGVRDAVTIPPVTEAGRNSVGAIGEALKPVGEALKTAESAIGDFVFEKTESPALAALATTIPTATLELLGLKGAQRFQKNKRIGKDPSGRKIDKALSESAPSIDQLKETSRAVFKEIDDLGGSVRPQAYQDLVNRLNKSAKESGLSAGGTPKANSILNEFNELLGDAKTTIDPVTGAPRTSRLGRDISLVELDDLRTKMQGLAKSTEPAESAIGVAMIDTVDSFLDGAGEGAIKLPEGTTANIGKRYKAARQLWGRAKRSEMIQEAFDKAGRQASGFENGIRTQFRQILNNKKRSRFFSKEELAVMESVVTGTKKQNFFRLAGRLGFSEGQATNVVGGAIGGTIGGSIAGTPGAVVVPFVGNVSRSLAQKLTAKGAVFADDMIRAGKNGKKIVTSYLRHVPKAQRSVEELSQLLLKPDVDLNVLKSGGKFVDEAVQIARDRRKALAVAAGTGAVVQKE